MISGVTGKRKFKRSKGEINGNTQGDIKSGF
jgi:hypothetical protein